MRPAVGRSLFETALKYEGPAALVFHDDGEIVGTALLQIDEELRTTSLLRVTEIRYSGPLGFPLDLMQPAVPGTTRPIPHPSAPSFASSFRMQLPAGEVRSASGKVLFAASVHFGEQPEATLRLDLGPTEFLAGRGDRPKYFVVPLVNYIADWPAYNAALDAHPMRVLRAVGVSEEFARQHSDIVEMERRRLNGTIEFVFHGRSAFIQPISDYEERQGNLESGASRARITALLVGEIADRLITWPAVDTWFPSDLQGLLSLATGSDVEFPWIEFRSEDGALVRRIHFHNRAPVFTHRGHIIRESVHLGTGRLLSNGLRSPHFGKPHLRSAIHTICSRPDRVLNLDHRLLELLVTLESVAKGPGVIPADVKPKRLSTRWRKAVRKALSEAAAAIERFAEDATNLGDAEGGQLLRKLAPTVRCWDYEQLTFGEIIRTMLDVLGLPDASVLEPWFRSHPYWQRDWISVIAGLRSRVVHRGIVGVGAEGRSTAEVWELARHLEDLLVRIVLRLLKYDASYQPTVAQWATQAPVGWVTRETTPAELGFTSVGEPGQRQAQEGGPRRTGPEDMGS